MANSRSVTPVRSTSTILPVSVPRISGSTPAPSGARVNDDHAVGAAQTDQELRHRRRRRAAPGPALLRVPPPMNSTPLIDVRWTICSARRRPLR